MSDKILFNCTHGQDDPERATLPFVAANVAATAGQDAVVVCTVDAVWLGTPGGTDGVQAPGLPALAELYNEFVDNGGQVWLCGACTKPRGLVQAPHSHTWPRGITGEHLEKGATIIGAAKVVEEVVNGAKTVAFA